MARLRVAYDARPLKPQSRHWGPGVFVENMLARLGNDFQFLGLAQSFRDSRRWQVRSWPAIPKLNSILFEASPLLAKRPDVYWGTNDFIPHSWNGPSVLTVHDLLILNNMDGETFARFFGWRFRSSLRRASVVIADSRTTANDLLTRFPELRGKVEVALLGVAAGAPAANADAASEGLPDAPYVIMLGAHRPRKNLGLALSAAARLMDQGIKIQLLITGDIHPSFAGLLRRRPDNVRTVGVLPTEKVISLLRGATALFFPSRYEGFGLPLLEAMAAACPVLALDTPINREIGGGAAWLLPEDPAEWAKACKALMTSPSIRVEMREKGFENLTRFSWDQTAAVYHEAFTDVGC